MGKEILYCNKCGKQLSGDDFTRGRAHTYDNRQFCSACVPATHTPKPMPTVGSSSRIPKRQASSMHLPVQSGEPSPPSSSALVVSIVVAGGVVILLLVLFLNPSSPAPASAPQPVAPRPAEVRKPSEDPLQKAVEQAREFSSGNPHAVDERVRRWEQVVAAAAKSPYAEEARTGLERAIAARKEEFAQELKVVEPKIAERLKVEQFGAAVDVLEEAKKRHDSPEWAAAVAVRIREVQDVADKLYPELKTKAVAAQAMGDAIRVVEQRTRLNGWGRKDLAADLDLELSKVVPREPLPEGATLLMKFPKEGSPSTYRLVGSVIDRALVMPKYNERTMLGGFESIREPLVIPSEGELWLTYSTNTAVPIQLRFRVIRGDKTQPYNFVVDTPVVGRPARVKIPMLRFKDYGKGFVTAGDRFGTIYIQQDDPKAQLMVHEVLIFRTKE